MKRGGLLKLTETLTAHAPAVDRLCSAAWWPRVFYEMMSGALLWSDEFDNDWPATLISAMRVVFAYRTSLMLGKPREEFRPIWELGESLFPNWVGFRPERRTQTPALMRVYRRGRRDLLRSLKEVDGTQL